MLNESEVVSMYNEQGLTAPAIAERLGCGSTTVYRALGRAGIVPSERRRKRGYDAKLFGRDQQILVMYRTGRTMESIATEFGVDRNTVRNTLVRLDEPLRHRGPEPSTFTQKERERMAALRAEGWTQEQIANELKTSQPRVSKELVAMGLVRGKVKRNRRERIKTRQGYAMVLLHPDDPLLVMAHTSTRYVLEHRIVMARHLGRALSPHETVHHINGDRGDNRLDNLELRSGRHGKHAAYRCVDCGSRNVVSTTLL